METPLPRAVSELSIITIFQETNLRKLLTILQHHTGPGQLTLKSPLMKLRTSNSLIPERRSIKLSTE